jgi:hypothetical protein
VYKGQFLTWRQTCPVLPQQTLAAGLLPFKTAQPSKRSEEPSNVLSREPYSAAACAVTAAAGNRTDLPMECPKGLRNGPCGGSTPEHCYVMRPPLRVVQDLRTGREARPVDVLMEVMPAPRLGQGGHSPWPDGWKNLKKHADLPPSGAESAPHRLNAGKVGALLQGDPPAGVVAGGRSAPPRPLHAPVSRLEQVLMDGKFAITAEPPRHSRPTRMTWLRN